ncbi:hypothetical protein FNF27_02127 [Cafeteria roenbergensis]|uniref:Uncharacterized protein n=1 Tax=Cafeteria roenbergensis TaxID=33653 RepID=A0A5A8EL07_CAFRO|nr:hypothetical protein FNF28_01511 [Cafeteria roenbergensis]KAA0176431.1 hypothetical protein FNF27_02127 [Cafeteria roenbergensis]
MAAVGDPADGHTSGPLLQTLGKGGRVTASRLRHLAQAIEALPNRSGRPSSVVPPSPPVPPAHAPPPLAPVRGSQSLRAGFLSTVASAGAAAKFRKTIAATNSPLDHLYGSSLKAKGLPVRELLQATYTMTRRKLFLEAVFFSLFLVTFVGVCFSIYDVHKAFQTNDALIDLFLDEEFEGATYKKNFYEIMTMEELWVWLKGPVINGALPDQWYNGDPFTPEEQGLVLYAPRLVGGIQLRQARVRDGTCGQATLPALQFDVPSAKCFGDFSIANQDTRPFGPNGTYTWSNNNHAMEGLFGYGPSYGTGGYVTVLPADQKNASEVLDSMEAARWIDRGTRAVMVMMNFYNVQTDLVTVVRLIVELFPSGHVVKSHKFYSFQAGLYDNFWSFVRGVFEVAIFVCVLAFLARELRAMYEAKSVSSHLSSLGNAFEIGLHSLAVTFVVYWIMFLLAPDRLNFTVRDEKFRDIFAVAERYSYAFTIAGFIGLLFTLKLFRYFGVSLQMQALFNTMQRAAPDLLAFMFGFLLLVAGFSFSGCLLWGGTVSEFHSVAASFSSLLRLSLGDFDYNKLAAAQPIVTGYFFAIYVVIVYLIAMNILIAIVTMYFEEVTRLLKREESWKQALPGIESEALAMLRRVPSGLGGSQSWFHCGCCPRAEQGPEPDDDAAGLTLAPRQAMRAAEAAFHQQLGKIMHAIQRLRGRSLEDFMRDMFLETRNGEQVYINAPELRKLCSSPSGHFPDNNSFRSLLRCLCPCCCGPRGCCAPVRGFMRKPAGGPRGEERDDGSAARIADPVDRLMELYSGLKCVTLVGASQRHHFALDTFDKEVDGDTDFDFIESTLSVPSSPMSSRATARRPSIIGPSQRLHETQSHGVDDLGRPWFVVKKINVRGVMQTRQMVLHCDLAEASHSFLLNYDRHGFIRRRLQLQALAQIEQMMTDDRLLGLLFIKRVKSHEREESIIADAKDSYYLLLFKSGQERQVFVETLQNMLNSTMSSSSEEAIPHPVPGLTLGGEHAGRFGTIEAATKQVRPRPVTASSLRKTGMPRSTE